MVDNKNDELTEDELAGITGGGNVLGSNQNDELTGSDGADLMYGGGGDDTLHGEDGNDALLGGSGDDELFGDAGNDTLRGGAGDDTLSGGTGQDLFTFGQNDGHDTITDLGYGDRLSFDGLTSMDGLGVSWDEGGTTLTFGQTSVLIQDQQLSMDDIERLLGFGQQGGGTYM